MSVQNHARRSSWQFQRIGNVFSQGPHSSEMAIMKDLPANQTEDADLDKSNVCLNSLTPPAKNAFQAVASVDGFQGGVQNVGSGLGSASKNALVFTRTNVHQNAHQRIQKDIIGYVQIGLDCSCKPLKIRLLHFDSDPRLQLQPRARQRVRRLGKPMVWTAA